MKCHMFIQLTRELAAVQSNLETQQKQLVDTEVQLKGAVQVCILSSSNI